MTADNNPPAAGNVDTTPTFRIVQARPVRYVLILDTSGSMTEIVGSASSVSFYITETYI